MRAIRSASPIRTPAAMIAAILLCAPAATPARAGDAPPPPAPPPPAQGALGGPTVNDHDVPGAPSTFGAPRAPSADGKRQMVVPHKVFMDAVRSLNADGADPALRLTPEQAAKIRTIEEDFRAKQQAFYREHRDELDQLRREVGSPSTLGQGPAEGAPPPGRPTPRKKAPPSSSRPNSPDDAMPGRDMAPPPPGPAGAASDSAASNSARDRLARLRALAPDPAAVHVQVYEALTAAQRDAVEQKLKSFRDEQIAQRARREVRGKMKDGAAPPAPAGARGRNLTPEQRAKLRERRRADQPGDVAPPPPHDPPGLDDVNVPPPDAPKPE